MRDLIISALAKIGIHINGALADRLNNLIERQSDDDDERSDLIDRMASAAGIDRSTLLQILSGSIETPPEQRLRGFAEILGVSLESLTALVGNKKEDEISLTFKRLFEKIYIRETKKANSNRSE